jgi:hypothetical protein
MSTHLKCVKSKRKVGINPTVDLGIFFWSNQGSINKQELEMNRTTSLIASTAAQVILNNPHFTDAQVQQMTFQLVFGAYNGTEADRRNMYLCRV